MALLDRNAPHKVRVQRRKQERNDKGQRVWVNEGDPVEHRCAVQPARDWSQAEETAGPVGLQVLDMAVVFSRDWSGDVNSYIYWDGDVYETIGAPQRLSMSRRTTHWRITLKRLGTAP
ncbi:hypothetical protein SK224_08335 [Microbacterium sp. BG28]|uniref:hypothetical protein n=1 Tax=Microbacterium sp. BG28 TaxID=3097356 RepID=UPI002A5ADA42|nr:hypothetical protein [Microbacterium sp. BG28]MDY0829132.1 hypothetical protein [Microbacterium sp. BG28]